MDERYKGIKPEKLPRVWFKYYVVYKYKWFESTYIVGLDSDVDADRLQQDLLCHDGIERCEIFGHYPVELLK